MFIDKSGNCVIGVNPMDVFIHDLINETEELTPDQLIDRAVYQVVNHITLPKREYKPKLAHSVSILPPQGWFVTIVHEYENKTKEGLGTIKDPQRIPVLNPNAPEPWDMKRLKAFCQSGAMAKELNKLKEERLETKRRLEESTASEKEKLDSAVDDFLAKQQLDGKLKF